MSTRAARALAKMAATGQRRVARLRARSVVHLDRASDVDFVLAIGPLFRNQSHAGDCPGVFETAHRHKMTAAERTLNDFLTRRSARLTAARRAHMTAEQPFLAWNFTGHFVHLQITSGFGFMTAR